MNDIKQQSDFDIAVIGLGVMGTSFCQNLYRNGMKVAAYDLLSETVNRFNADFGGEAIHATANLTELVKLLKKPRKIVLLISPGAPIDSCLDQLIPLLDSDDIVLDFGNSHFRDTERRQERVSEKNIKFIGVGISGGREGALNGPSLMPGGNKEALKLVMPILQKVAAKADGKPCVGPIGEGGAGHFVKTIHNGIEYGLMQAIAEVYDLLRMHSFSAGEIGEIFSKWSEGKLGSFLMEVSASCLKKVDAETGVHLVDLISDRAEQKGTGKWTIVEALNLGVPCSALVAALEARNLSANLQDRNSLACFRGESVKPQYDKAKLIEECEQALLFAYLVCYSQGFSILDAASEAFEWNLNLAEISFIWKAGCIIRSVLLDDIQEALQNTDEKQLLLGRVRLHENVDTETKALRNVLSHAMQLQVPVPVLSASLSYFDSLKAEKLPQNLVQAQRDFFGGHKFKRIDREGYFSLDWTK